MRKLMIIIVGIIIPGVLVFAVYKGYNLLFEANVNPNVAPYSLYVSDNTTIEEVYGQFLEDQVLEAPDGFLLLASKKGLTHPKSGHYLIESGQSSNTIVNMLMAGFQSPVRVHFTGGASLRDLSQKLAEQLMVGEEELYIALSMEREGWEGPAALGAYMPDTYEMYWNASASSVAEKLYQNTVRFWSPERVEQAEALGLSPAGTSTLASIVMKESSEAEDRPKVARLYLNRLDIGMKLQADPTVIYALKRKNPEQKIQRVLTKDLSIQDPYNTYYVKGLPPGPICVAERAALEAVLNAPKHEYIFMCADPERFGFHAFAKSYNEHLRNQRKWTAYLNRRKIYR